MTKESKARIGHVNSDHLWYGYKNGEGAALRDFKESEKNESTAVAVAVAVVRLSDYQQLEEKLRVAVEALEKLEFNECGCGCNQMSSCAVTANTALKTIRGEK